MTAAEMLSVAAFDSGRHAQAFPTFGSERTGAPVVSFCRISDVPIRFHEPVDVPDAVVIQDPTLLAAVPVLEGVTERTTVLVNTARTPDQLHLDTAGRVSTLAATELAREVLGRPLPNTALLGALAGLTGVVTLDALVDAIRQRFTGDVADANVEVAVRAHTEVGIHA